MRNDGTGADGHPALRGMRVVVTGAAGLIGRRLTYRFAEAGADVVAVDRDVTRLRHEFAGVRHILPIPGDVADEVFADDLFAELGRLDRVAALVNNAAVTRLRVPFLQTTTEEFDAMLAANLRSVYLLSHRAAQGWQRTRSAGAIINLSCSGALRAHAAQSLYDASKGGVEALSRAMATELGPLGIRVNCLAPAAVSEPGVSEPGVSEPGVSAPGVSQAGVSEAGGPEAGLPLRGRVTPDDIADAALFLASPAASQITGIVLPVDGGLNAQLRPSAGRTA